MHQIGRSGVRSVVGRSGVRSDASSICIVQVVGKGEGEGDGKGEGEDEDEGRRTAWRGARAKDQQTMYIRSVLPINA